MRLIAFTLLGALGVIQPASGEIEKIAMPCTQGLCFHWWPKLPEIEGWRHDREQSLNLGVNALAPNGSSFRDAEAVLYAKAVYKPRLPQTTSLEMFVEHDRKEFAERAKVADAAFLPTADGRRLRSLTFFPAGANGNWERVSYGEEGEFYVVFTISARSLKSYTASLPAYKILIARYKETP